MKFFIFFFTILISIISFASESAHGGHEEIPVKTIIYQTINVTIMFAALFYFLKNPVKDFFKQKKDLFLSFAERAQSQRQAAEEQHQEIKVKLTKLESTADESISRAKAEAADLKKQLIDEANSLSKRIKTEAETTAKLEIEKAKNHLREEMIKEATALARNQMSTKVSTEDHKRLQGEFIESIQAVQP